MNIILKTKEKITNWIKNDLSKADTKANLKAEIERLKALSNEKEEEEVIESEKYIKKYIKPSGKYKNTETALNERLKNMENDIKNIIQWNKSISNLLVQSKNMVEKVNKITNDIKNLDKKIEKIK